VNLDWHYAFEHIHETYLHTLLSDHCPLLLGFLTCPKPKSPFRFYNMSSSFHKLVSYVVKGIPRKKKLQVLIKVLKGLQKPLLRLNKDKDVDIHTQQMIHRGKLEGI